MVDNQVDFETSLCIVTTDNRVDKKLHEIQYSLHEWEKLLQRMILCMNCNSYFEYRLDRSINSCWSCKTDYETVDDSHGHGVSVLLAKVVGQDDSEAVYLVGEDGDGWAYAEWCNLIGKEFDVADEFWNC